MRVAFLIYALNIYSPLFYRIMRLPLPAGVFAFIRTKLCKQKLKF
ncbi:hypothetical protein HMPREF1621_04629 [Escherichia coli A25922R]|nr:hypothetical protein i02_4169 [Escherichia coli str. 'clone D i2']AER91614.1 hypothetical protein i14_4169 [Escherichia coli str. 'clone D i14']EEJ49619.1 hypothetical protein HMPREF0358_0467 [Escherichia coli 83972]EFJ91828.1 hypothetical protein HMPREF9531_03065 [Escherichia coli MS 45-1]ESD01886.1 hypothetical protein HMPREF1593_00472 [Escherichia coli 907391]ESD43238.1 hypothetical protein HMPREF1603_00469 [Escherichia coli 907892]ESE29186.1 hypothetical protein HMPREF1621_04629 [Esche